MELWLRSREAQGLDYDLKLDLHSQHDWHRVVGENKPISSVLWRSEPLYRPLPMVPEDIFGRHHRHERVPVVAEDVFNSYRMAAQRVASHLAPLIKDRKVLVYAPLRGAFPIWRAISAFLPVSDRHVYHPVTSSFVFYPVSWGIKNHKGQTHSGRFANILELKRLKPLLKDFDLFVYVDEIVSGSMMYAHVKEMAEVNIKRFIPIVVVGLADAHGSRSERKRLALEEFKRAGAIEEFIWEGCDSLITEDNKFMLGWHYVDYAFGLNVVPVLTETLDYPAELHRFEDEVLTKCSSEKNL